MLFDNKYQNFLGFVDIVKEKKENYQIIVNFKGSWLKIFE